MTVLHSTQKPWQSRIPDSIRALPGRLSLGLGRATDWLSGDYLQRPRSQIKEGSMKTKAKMSEKAHTKVKRSEKALVFLQVAGIIVAYLALILSISYPVFEAASRTA